MARKRKSAAGSASRSKQLLAVLREMGFAPRCAKCSFISALAEGRNLCFICRSYEYGFFEKANMKAEGLR